MNDNQKRLKKRVIQASEEALYKNQYVSPIDVFLGLKTLQSNQVEDWRKGRIPYLEKCIQGSLGKITFCMKCFRDWAKEKGLKPSYTDYLSRTRGGRKELRFSISGHPKIEESYRTHYVSPLLFEIKEKKIQEKMKEIPDATVYGLMDNSQCSQCSKKGKQGDFFYMKEGSPLCLICANLNEFEFLPRNFSKKLVRQLVKEGVKLTRVVEFKRASKRYELQGQLVEIRSQIANLD